MFICISFCNINFLFTHHAHPLSCKEAKRVRESIECELNISYGMADDQKLDIFGANTLPRGWYKIRKKTNLSSTLQNQTLSNS